MSEVPTSVFVISAPSGAGKTSLCRRLVAEVEHLRFSTSHTTRAPREDEIDGADYHFIDKARFQAMIQDKQFAEWAQIHENYYGTAKSELTAAEEHGDDLLLDIEGQGAQQIRETWPDSVHIFITVPSLEVLRRRLTERNTNSEEEIDRRVANAKREIAFMPQYDFVVVNDDLDEALAALKSIVLAERRRTRRVLPALPEDLRP